MSQNYQAYIMLQKNTSHGVIVIGRANDYLCYKNLRALVRSILVKFAPKIAMKLAVFYPLFLGEICRQISRQIGQFFFANLPQKIPWNLTFLRNLSEALMTYERALVLNNPSSKWPTNRWFFTVFFYSRFEPTLLDGLQAHSTLYDHSTQTPCGFCAFF